MRRIGLAVILAASLMVSPFAAAAHLQAGNVPRIGVLVPVEPASPTEPNLAAFCQGLRSLGYVEGENIAVEYRHALGNDKAYAEHAAEFVRLKVDVMVVGSGVPTRAALGLAGAPPTVDPRGAKK